MRIWALGLLTALFLSSSAWAKGPKKVAVMDIPPDANFSPNVTKIINSFLAGAVRDQGFSVVSSSDIGAALGLERQKALLGCSETSCMAEIGGALGVDYIVHGEMAVLESDTAVTLSLIDPNGKSVGQVREIVKGKSSEALLAAIERLVPKLMANARPKAEVPAAALPPPSGSVTAQQEGPSHTAEYALLGVGAAGLVASGVFGLMASNQQKTVNDHAAHGSLTTADQSTLNRDAIISTASLGVGLVAAGVGAAMLVFGGNSTAKTAQAGSASEPLALSF